MRTRTLASAAVLAMALLVLDPFVSVSADVDVQIVGSYGGAHGGGAGDHSGEHGGGGGYGGGEHGGGGGYGGGGYGGGGYGGGYGGHHGHSKWNDVETFLELRGLLIDVAINALGFCQLASLNEFNEDLVHFPYPLPGPLSLYVRELEKVPPYYKFDYLHKKPARGVDIVDGKI